MSRPDLSARPVVLPYLGACPTGQRRARPEQDASAAPAGYVTFSRMDMAPGVPAWLGVSLRQLDDVDDEQAFHAVMNIRAISWNWRFWEAVRRPRLLRGLGRRHYGVLAQDVAAQLGTLVPGIVLCDKGERCPQHGRGGTRCTGRLRVRYDLVALVTIAAARHLGEAALITGIPPAPSATIQRYCHDAIAAVHAASRPRSPQQTNG